MSSLRVPELKDNISSKIILSKESILNYDNDFSSLLLSDMKNDSTLELFIIRMRYECEVVKIVTENATDIDILDLEDIVHNLNNSNDLALISKHDMEFHKRLFAIVGDMDFFKWWRSQSKLLNTYMNNFWKSVGYLTMRYDLIMNIHSSILEAIKNKNSKQAIAQMERHFSFVIVQLMGSLFDSDRIS